MVVPLNPVGTGNAAWTVVGGATTLDCLDDGDTPDEDTTHVANTTTLNAKAAIRFQNVPLPGASTIASVILSARVSANSGSPLFRVFVTDGVTSVESANKTATGGYAEYTETYTTDPVTGASWTIDTVRKWNTATDVVRRTFGLSNRSATADTTRGTRLQATINATLGGHVMGGGVGGGFGHMIG
jgi:hypothetical protein